MEANFFLTIKNLKTGQSIGTPLNDLNDLYSGKLFSENKMWAAGFKSLMDLDIETDSTTKDSPKQ